MDDLALLLSIVTAAITLATLWYARQAAYTNKRLLDAALPPKPQVGFSISSEDDQATLHISITGHAGRPAILHTMTVSATATATLDGPALSPQARAEHAPASRLLAGGPAFHCSLSVKAVHHGDGGCVHVGVVYSFSPEHESRHVETWRLTALAPFDTSIGEYSELISHGQWCLHSGYEHYVAHYTKRYVALGREGKQTATRDREAHPATARMVEKLATPAGRTAYAERKWLSEAPNGWIKHVLGFRRFSLRGLAKVRCEWDLVCLALNVKRLQPLMAA